MRTNSYHNTSALTGADLDKAHNAARSQEQKIMLWLRQRPPAPISPSQVWQYLFRERVPLTSVRRALSNLTRDGLLEKSDKQVPGPYGRPEYLWRLPEPGGQLRLL